MMILFGDKGGIGRYISVMENPFGRATGQTPQFVSCNREQCDIERPGAVEDFLDETLVHYAACTPLYVINATGKNISGYLHKQDPEEFEAVIRCNLIGSWNILQAFARNVKGRRDASCLFMSSVCARTTTVPGVTAYSAAKAGLEGLVRAAAPELARYNARVNAIRMGYFDAGMKNTIPAAAQETIKDSIPLKEWGECGHLLNLIKTILINTYITGSVIDITGGL
jgi:3-oxoacyl-[acyl-carrier protein] reductase